MSKRKTILEEFFLYERGVDLIRRTRMFPGRVAFVLWSQYGLPWEITRDILKENGYDLYMKEYYEMMDMHRERSKPKGVRGGQ